MSASRDSLAFDPLYIAHHPYAPDWLRHQIACGLAFDLGRLVVALKRREHQLVDPEANP